MLGYLLHCSCYASLTDLIIIFALKWKLSLEIYLPVVLYEMNYESKDERKWVFQSDDLLLVTCKLTKPYQMMENFQQFDMFLETKRCDGVGNQDPTHTHMEDNSLIRWKIFHRKCEGRNFPDPVETGIITIKSQSSFPLTHNNRGNPAGKSKC